MKTPSPYAQMLARQHKERERRMRVAALKVKQNAAPPAKSERVRSSLKVERLRQETLFLRERESVLETLRQGCLMCRAYGEVMRPEAVIWALLKDAMEVMSRIRNREVQWLLSGDRGHWPEIVRRWKELYEIELTRIVSRLSEYDSAPTRLAEPSDAEVDRMLVTLSFLRFLSSRDPRRMRDCVLAMAAGAPSTRVAAMWRPGQKVARNVMFDLKVRACNQVLSELLKEYGIRWRGKFFDIT